MRYWYFYNIIDYSISHVSYDRICQLRRNEKHHKCTPQDIAWHRDILYTAIEVRLSPESKKAIKSTAFGILNKVRKSRDVPALMDSIKKSHTAGALVKRDSDVAMAYGQCRLYGPEADQRPNESNEDFAHRILEAFDFVSENKVNYSGETAIISFIMARLNKKTASSLSDYWKAVGGQTKPTTVESLLVQIVEWRDKDIPIVDDVRIAPKSVFAVSADKKKTNELVCKYCKRTGHIATHCWARKAGDDAKGDSIEGREMKRKRKGDVQPPSFVPSSPQGKRVNMVFCAAASSPQTSPEDRAVIFDSGSVIHLFKNRNLLKNIRRSDKPILICDAVGKETWIEEEGELEDVGKVYVSDKASINILSESLLAEKFAIKWTPTRHLVKIPGKPSLIFKLRQGLKMRMFKPVPNENVVCLITTNAQSITPLTADQLTRALRVKDLIRKLGYINDADMAKLISRGRLGFDLNTKDLANLRAKFGPDLESVRGKTIYKGPKALPYGDHEVLNVHKQVDLHIDVMFVSNHCL